MVKHKVGDKVRVKSKEWWDAQQKDKFYSVQCGENAFTKDMVKYCGLEAEIKFSDKHSYYLDIDNTRYCWTDEMLEDIEKKEEDLPIDTPVMCSNSIQGEYAWYVRYYAGDGKTWWDLGKSCNEKRKVDWKCIIPFDKFDPTNIEESLKHNIVKLYGQR